MLSQGARVGLEVALEGKQALLDEIGDIGKQLADALRGAGQSYNPLATPQNAGYAPQPTTTWVGGPAPTGTYPPGFPAPQAWTYPGFQPSYASQTAQTPQAPAAPAGPTTIQHADNVLFSGSATVTISSVQNAVFQGGAGGAGGQGGGGGGGGQGGGGGGGGAPDAQGTGRVRGFWGGVLGGLGLHQLTEIAPALLAGHFVSGAAASVYGARQAYAYSGGDIYGRQAQFQAWAGIPFLGGLINTAMGEEMRGELLHTDWMRTAAFMDTPQPFNAREPSGWTERYIAWMQRMLGMDAFSQFAKTSPTAARGATQMAMRGLRLSPELLRAFADRNETGLGYVPPPLRAALVGADERIRASEAGRASWGFGTPSIEDELRLAEAQGDLETAYMLRRFQARESGVWRPYADLEGIWQSRYAVQTRGAEAEMLGTRRALAVTLGGRGSAAGYWGQEAGVREEQARLAGVEAGFVRERYQQSAALYGADAPATQALWQRVVQLETRVASFETQAAQARIEEIEDRFGGLMDTAALKERRYGVYSEWGMMGGMGFRERLTAGTFGVYEASGRADLARQRREALQGAGVTGVRLEQAILEEEQAGMAAWEGAGRLARTPVDLGLQRAESFASFQVGILSNIPGSYGNLRGALRQQMQLQEQEALQIQEMRERQRRSGTLTPEADFTYQQRLQEIAGQQLSSFNQLSYGWESRLIGTQLGNPGFQNLEARGFAYRDAVLGGAVNPHFGATAEQLPFFMRYASNVPFPVIPGYRGYLSSGFGAFGVDLPTEGGGRVVRERGETDAFARIGLRSGLTGLLTGVAQRALYEGRMHGGDGSLALPGMPGEGPDYGVPEGPGDGGPDSVFYPHGVPGARPGGSAARRGTAHPALRALPHGFGPARAHGPEETVEVPNMGHRLSPLEMETGVRVWKPGMPRTGYVVNPDGTTTITSGGHVRDAAPLRVARPRGEGEGAEKTQRVELRSRLDVYFFGQDGREVGRGSVDDMNGGHARMYVNPGGAQH